MSEERLNIIDTRLDRIDERLEGIENTLVTVTQNMDVMQQNMNVMQQNMNVMQQNMNAMREDIHLLRQRDNSIEGAFTVIVRDGFNSLRSYLDDLNYDLAENESKLVDSDRKQRRLNRRVARLERKDEDD
jgi:predicted  nucleic acid-binding Zn-ribbon protein